MTMPADIAPYIGVAIIAIAASYYVFVKIIPRLQGRADLIRDARQESEEDEENDEDDDDDDEDGRIYFDDDGTLTPEQYKKVSLGAVYSEQQKAWINTLATGLRKKRVRNIVGSWWAITCPEEAVAKLDYLRDKGFRYYFPTVIRSLRHPVDEHEKIVFEAFPDNAEDREKALSQIGNLLEAAQDLEDDGVIASPADIEKHGVTAWDCGRLVFLARLCHEMGHISEKETWNYIDAADALARGAFHSWRAYAKSYVIGRTLWAGSEEDSDIAEIAEYLLEDEESPWVKMPW